MPAEKQKKISVYLSEEIGPKNFYQGGEREQRHHEAGQIVDRRNEMVHFGLVDAGILLGVGDRHSQLSLPQTHEF